MPIRVFVAETTCTICGRKATIVARRFVRFVSKPITSLPPEPCMKCKLEKMKKGSRDFFILEWRMLWRQAGRSMADLPPELAVPGDQFMAKQNPQAAGKGHGPGRALRDRQRTNVRFAETAPLPRSLTRRPTKRPRVLFISHDFSYTGAPRILLNVLPHLRGMDVTVSSLGHGPMRYDFTMRGVTVDLNPDFNSFDLVVGNTVLTGSQIAHAKALGFATQLWVHEFGPHWFPKNPVVAEGLSSADTVVFSHPAQAENFRSMREGGSCVIRSRVPRVPLYSKEEARRSAGCSNDEFVALSFGSDEKRKSGNDLKAAVAGSNITGMLISGRKAPSIYLSAADVYVCTSREETYSLALQEAKLAGLPVVTTDLPCAREMLEDNVSALFYKPGDVKTLREHLRALQFDPELRQRIAAASPRLPSWEETITAYEDVLLSAVGQGERRELTVVYHVAEMGDSYAAIVREQMELLAKVGLRTVYLSYCGPNFASVAAIAEETGVEIIPFAVSSRLEVYETPALEFIERASQCSDRPILYLHSKGVSHPQDAQLFHEWRRLQMDLLVRPWREHVAKLREYDAVGVNWWSEVGLEHFSGNFWLARASWLRQLPAFRAYYKDRYSCERWIGSVRGCQAHSLGCVNAKFWERDQQLLRALRGDKWGTSTI